MIYEDIDFLDDSSEHANSPRVLVLNKKSDLFNNKPKINFTKTTKLCNRKNLINNLGNKNEENKLGIKINNNNFNNAKTKYTNYVKKINLNNKIQNNSNNNLSYQKSFVYEKTNTKMENRRNILLKKQKEKMNKSKDFNCNKTEIKSKEKIKSYGINIKFNKISNIKSNDKQKIANTETKKINSYNNKGIISNKKILKNEKEKKRKNTYLIYNNFKSTTNNQNKKINSYKKENKINRFHYSSKILSSFKFNSYKPKENIRINSSKYINLLFDKMIQSNKKIQNFHRSSKKLALSKFPKRTSKKSIKNENLDINTNISNTKIKHNIINEKKIEKNSSSECFSEESGSKEKKINNNNNKLNNNKSISSFKDLLRKEKKYIIKNHYILSKAGKDDSGSMKINQDSYLFLPKVNGLKDFNIFGVLDGHGPEGHYVSQFVSRYFQLEFNNKEFIGNIKDINLIYQKISSNNFRIIRDLFINADNLLHDQEIESRNSGTTCVLVIHIGEHIICANTGDSRAILIYDKNKKNEFKVFPLSIDCKPELKEEKERIKKMGGIVEKIKNKNGKEIGPYRVWNKTKEYPGLSMSRSIGDFNGKNVGIIPDPQIIETNFGININYIVICSDGVWEFLKNDDIMKIGNKYYKENNPHDFCKEVVDLATKCWQKSDDIVDDITMVTAFF